MFAPFKKISFTIRSSFHSQVTNSSDSSPLSSALVMNESDVLICCQKSPKSVIVCHLSVAEACTATKILTV